MKSEDNLGHCITTDSGINREHPLLSR